MNDYKRKTYSKARSILDDLQDVARIGIVFLIVFALFKLFVWLFQLIFN